MASRAVLIDPAARAVTDVTVNLDTLTEVYSLLDCRTVEVVRTNKHGQLLLVDEDGSFKPDNQAFIAPTLYPGALVGKALIVGEDGAEMVSTSLIASKVPVHFYP